jgi:uncharacterized protein (DUF488 family)
MQLFDGQIDKISLQKLLFLFSKRQSKPEYDFIPYLYGCYSYSVNADLTTMVKKGMLMKHTYINFPYWAINSVKAKELLNDVQFEKVLNSKPKIKETILFTIGYEGISLEEYINRLLINDIKVLVDVRRNPLSMKYGFNKNQMKRYCENLGIEYVHFPEVGIQSEQRQQLNNQKDYDKLFDYYRNNNLIKNFEAQSNILALLKDHKRIALTCFEANICQCHRKHLAEAIENLPEFKYEIKHI